MISLRMMGSFSPGFRLPAVLLPLYFSIWMYAILKKKIYNPVTNWQKMNEILLFKQ